MLLTSLALGLALLSPQEPQDTKSWVNRGFDPVRPGAYSVEGVPELTRQEAFNSARERAIAGQRIQMAQLGARRAESLETDWLPSFLRERVVADWATAQAEGVEPKVLDRELIVRDHEFGRSYQAFLLVDETGRPAIVKAQQDGLRRSLARAEKRFIAKCGGAVGLWGLLALALAWIDRLTRGYMTGRLCALGALLATCVPILLVLL